MIERDYQEPLKGNIIVRFVEKVIFDRFSRAALKAVDTNMPTDIQESFFWSNFWNHPDAKGKIDDQGIK